MSPSPKSVDKKPQTHSSPRSSSDNTKDGGNKVGKTEKETKTNNEPLKKRLLKDKGFDGYMHLPDHLSLSF